MNKHVEIHPAGAGNQEFQVWLVVGPQSFMVATPWETRAEAEWYAERLTFALTQI